jgi:hypothetical protein
MGEAGERCGGLRSRGLARTVRHPGQPESGGLVRWCSGLDPARPAPVFMIYKTLSSPPGSS